MSKTSISKVIEKGRQEIGEEIVEARESLQRRLAKIGFWGILFFYLIISTLVVLAILIIRVLSIEHEALYDEPTLLAIFEMNFDSQFGSGSLFTLLNAILLFNFYLILAIVLLRLWGFVLVRISPHMTRTTLNTIRVIGRMIIIPFCAIAYLNTFPAFQGTLVSVAALFGAAIGFASTTTISNLLAGFYLMLARPFLIRDYIIIPNMKLEGVVREININYTTLDLPTGTTAMISNNSLLKEHIINTREIKLEKDKYGRDIPKIYYVYPQVWGVNSDEKHVWAEEAINMTIEQFKDRVFAPITWFVLSRARLDRMYQVSLPVERAKFLLDLTGDFMSALSDNYDIVKQKYSIKES